MPSQQYKDSKQDTTTEQHEEETVSLPHSQAPYQGLHSPSTRARLPSSTFFSGTQSHQNGLEQFKQGTEVTKRTATVAIGSIRFNLNGFTYYFTFFSKFFSSFPHGTCSLSVSRKYLALDGHYHPVSAAVPSNTTHGKGSWWGRPHGTGL